MQNEEEEVESTVSLVRVSLTQADTNWQTSNLPSFFAAALQTFYFWPQLGTVLSGRVHFHLPQS